MEFTNKPPVWNATGAEPSADLQENGFVAGYKPPAAYFNYLFNTYTKCVNELQSILGNRNLKTYTTLEQLGVTTGSETIESIVAAMPNLSLLHCATTSDNNMSIYPSEYGGTLIVEKSFGNRAKFTYFTQTKEWTGHYYNGTWNGWSLTYDEANPPTAQKVNSNVLTGDTSILDYALSLGVGTYEFSINGASYTGGDLPNANYSYGRATIHKRASNAITVIVWGLNASNATVPQYNQYGSAEVWSGWKALFTTDGGTLTGNLIINKASPEILMKHTTLERYLNVFVGSDGIVYFRNAADANNRTAVYLQPETAEDFTKALRLQKIVDSKATYYNIFGQHNVTCGTSDLTAGTSALGIGYIYQVYK